MYEKEWCFDMPGKESVLLKSQYNSIKPAFCRVVKKCIFGPSRVGYFFFNGLFYVAVFINGNPAFC
jgi:hypothetical protein